REDLAPLGEVIEPPAVERRGVDLAAGPLRRTRRLGPRPGRGRQDTGGEYDEGTPSANASHRHDPFRDVSPRRPARVSSDGTSPDGVARLAGPLCPADGEAHWNQAGGRPQEKFGRPARISGRERTRPRSVPVEGVATLEPA